MKKLLATIFIVGLSCFLAIVAYVHFFDKERAETRLAQANLSNTGKVIAKPFFDNGCQYCHSPNADLPFYAKLPVVGTIMEQDILKGTRAFRLDRLVDSIDHPENLSEADLAKLEYVIQNQTMPITSFTHLHWGTKPNDEERKTILDWIHQQRNQYFLPKNTDGVDATRLVQPIPDKLETNPAQVALGNKLYHDGRLSGDGTIQCHTCHQLAKGGVDGLQFSKGIDGQVGGINAPTVYNAAFNFLQFWDGRAKDLADQAGGPPLNPIEMGSKNWEEILARFKSDDEFMKEFLAVYPEFNEKTLTHAIGEFEKTLITPNSPFDKYLKGDENALTEVEKRGYQHFKSAKCDTCHTGIAMGGQSFEYMGLYGDYFKDRGIPMTDADQGRFAQTKDPYDMHRFKVPTLRNVALTAPYMHDGSVKDLKEAVRIMAVYQSGKDLSEQELDEITAFLKSLTGELDGKPLTLEK
ncbi:cytochrome c peroxidase [Bisgaardia hudsonensis]|uniref:Cytochrome c peroxidase n=1 Tax=Bisgaardia hudsonensis TaxID=109472 RepID=A0A4V2SJ62_9PAST|nr:cytochrome c peroxidase [Bisgaardia hudsonensis]QLB13175.1 cytochrome-c peroxidase [Bisgaardia hudsonensis]TCP13251.1 cytochrome c peroxidase [Bisgaardia hudsonensis]